jgi:glycine/D-amino acid oxidase-like deaminating enzyme/nitrite reductase/ring-hydroxylating ferredoxin subunit
MASELLHPHSVWSATAEMPVYPPLSANINAEVCVIGAGLAGVTTAYLLARQGVSVAVVEALDIGAGETSRTTAHIAVPDDRYSHIEQAYGPDAARLVADSFAAAIDFIETTVRTEQIDCAFERLDGYLFSCASEPRAALEREHEAARRAGVDVAMEDQLPVGTLGVGPCLRFARQAQFHPLRYLGGLTRAIDRRGGVIFAGTRALDVDERHGGVTVRTATGKITADAAVVATNTPFNDRVAIHVKQNAYQTYVVAALVERGSLPRALIWDDGDPYHYIRLADVDAEHELLIVGGADHKTGQEPDPDRHYRELEAWLRERFPQAGRLAYRWSGEVMEPLDGIAYIGRNPGSSNVYVITGDSGNGMTHATIGGMLVSDLIMGRQNRWLSIYDPARKPFKEALHFLREQSNIAAQYTDWVSGGDETNAASLVAGEGALIRAGLKKFAVYCDAEGALHCHSAKCPHLGCVVQWNGVEKTWDCPCHGSRFSAYGSVLHGPAVSGLTVASEEEWAEIVKAPSPARREGEGKRTE